MRELHHVCVFCSSSSGTDPSLRDAAAHVGEVLTQQGIDLVYGGAKVGLMRVIADTVLEHGGRVIGVIDELLAGKEIAHDGLSALHITESLAARKARMSELSDGFLVLPGGYGTLDELFEVVVWSQLHLHDKPIGLLDLGGFWQPMLSFLDQAAEWGLISAANRSLLLVDRDVEALLDSMRSFRSAPGEKWLG